MRTISEIGSAECIGKIPDGWAMMPLKQLFRFSKGLSITKADLVETGIPVISYGQIHSKANRAVSQDSSLFRFVNPETVLDNSSSETTPEGFVFADTSEDLEGCGNCVRIEGQRGIYGGYHTIVLTPLGHYKTRYLAYLFTTDAWRWQIRRDLVDVKLFSVSQRALKETYVICPPSAYQKRIVSYLDKRCAAIDANIEKRRELITKLEEYRGAIISNAISGNIDGIDRTRWTAKRFKYIASVDANLVPVDDYQEWPHVSPETIGKGNGKLLGRRTVAEDKVISDNHLFRKGAILYSKVRPALNKVTIAPFDGLCSADMYPISTSQSTRWLLYCMLSAKFVSQADSISGNRIKMPKINSQELGDIEIDVPPMADQEKIVEYLDKKTAGIDAVEKRENQLIDKLQEYRKSIIYNAVTGKTDCTRGEAR